MKFMNRFRRPGRAKGAAKDHSFSRARPKVEELEPRTLLDGATVSIQSLTFGGPGFHVVFRDKGTQDGYAGPQWTSGRTDNAGDPVAYEADTTMRVTAMFSVTGLAAGKGAKISVQGTDPQGIDIPLTTETVIGAAAGPTTFSISGISATKAVPTSISVFDGFTITWQDKINGGALEDAGASKDQVYVTLKDPSKTLKAKLFHTVVDLSCRNAQGDTDPDKVLADVWSAFSKAAHPGLDFLKGVEDGKPLTYYANYKNTNLDVADLLKNDDGQCGAFTDLFLNCLLAEGLKFTDFKGQSDNKVYDTVTPAAGYSGFLVNNWTFAGAGPYVNIATSPATYREATGYKWVSADVTQGVGIPGQNNGKPASLFGNHQLAKIGGVYYDPSYGLTFSSLQDLDDKAIAGVFKFTTTATGMAKFTITKHVAGTLDIRENLTVPLTFSQ